MEGVSGRHPPGRQPHHPTATAAEGTHPTGMHFCSRICLKQWVSTSPPPQRIPGYFQNMFETMGGLIVKQIIECNVLKHTYRKENNTVPKLVNIQLATTNHLLYQE